MTTDGLPLRPRALARDPDQVSLSVYVCASKLVIGSKVICLVFDPLQKKILRIAASKQHLALFFLYEKCVSYSKNNSYLLLPLSSGQRETKTRNGNI